MDDELWAVTASLVSSQDQFMALYELSQSMQRRLDLDEALAALTHTASRIIRAEAVLAALDLAERPFQVFGSMALQLETAVVQQWLRQAQNGRAQTHPLPDGTGIALAVPVRVNEQIAAILIFINKTDAPFATPDIKLGQTIAAQASIHIENILFHEESVAQARLQAEMKLACDVQTNLLPTHPPDITGLEIWAGSKPALQVGGDFYDFILRSDEEFVFNIGDVSGKGLSAALLMTMTRTTLRNALDFCNYSTMETALDKVNAALYDDMSDVGMFTTLFMGQYDSNTRQLVYVNAGHAPVIYYPIGGSARLLEADGPAIGMLSENLAKDHVLFLRPGDLLVAATDGLNEARNQDGSMFGYDRLLQLVEEMAVQSAAEIADGLLTAVNTFAADRPQDDDQTLIVIKGIAA